jgi:hypothetical protein
VENQTVKQDAVPEWWPPLRARLEERVRRHLEDQRVSSHKRLPRKAREWFKQAKAVRIVPGRKRAGKQLALRSFFPGYERLLSLGGTLDDGNDDAEAGGIAVWFGGHEGILTKRGKAPT